MRARAPDVRAAAAEVTALPFHESATLDIAAPRDPVFAFPARCFARGAGR
jgi:hypothetical protein